jgi:hypothetical protein
MRFDRFTLEAQAAKQFQDDYVSTEHLRLTIAHADTVLVGDVGATITPTRAPQAAA